MNRISGLVIAGLVLMLGVTLSWGGPPNPTESDAFDNTAGGTGALLNVTGSTSPVFGVGNTAFGFHALFRNTTGLANTATGRDVLFNNTTGNFNTASGFSALSSNTTGSNTTGSNTTATGFSALSQNTTGFVNTATGSHALAANTTGQLNTASGRLALGNNRTGDDNTALGSSALLGSIMGSKNIAVGYNAGTELVQGNKNIYLGHLCHPSASGETKTMRLGEKQTRTFIAGVATTAVNGNAVHIDANGQLGVLMSSARYKRDIEPMGARSEDLSKLRPVTFVYAHDGQGVRQYGLIAEEVVAVYPELVTHTRTGEVQAVRYHELIPLLLNELQRQQRQSESQQRELDELRGLVRALVGGKVQAEQ